MSNAWQGFKDGAWQNEINVSDFIKLNYTPYEGDYSFLEGPTEATTKLWDKLSEMMKVEKEKGLYDVETKIPSAIDAYGPGYIDKSLEKIVGVQTDHPLKRGIFPKGGLSVVKNALQSYGYELDPQTEEIFKKYRKTHNDGVFSAYTPEIRACRNSGIITGLPDAYGRGRIIGDYRRIALYGLDRLIQERKEILKSLEVDEMTENVIRDREELSEQVNALEAFRRMCESYGFDCSQPAKTAQEAVQMVYFSYLAAIKDQDGAAMSLGRTSTFLDVYIERDLKAGLITEKEAQELVDHFIMKLRIVRFLRTPEYNDLFSGDPTWTTEVLGGQSLDGSTLVTKTCFRYLQTLYNIGPAPEPNLTILWSVSSPKGWKEFCSKVSIDTSALQYENDDLMRPQFGDDYAIACCVSPMKVGKGMQFFGARVNLPKALLYAINGGIDEKNGKQIAPTTHQPITSEYLDYEEVKAKYDDMLDWLAGVYVRALNIIHYMHDKYAYESFEMALHDLEIARTQAFGIAGLSIITDSLQAIKNAKVKVIRNEEGLAVDYECEGEWVAYGNNDDAVDAMAVEYTEKFMNLIRKHQMYRNARPTMSVLTITSNVVYGKKTGNTPCGRRSGTPFAPGANPMNGRDVNGAVASLASVSKLPFDDANDGISYTWAITPNALGKESSDRINNLISLMDGYFTPTGGQHLNVNVFDRALLEKAMKSPQDYPQLTVRVSGYAVNFTKLTEEQQLDVLSRTINERF